VPSVSENLASRIGQARERAKDVGQTAEKLLIDIAGLCVAARKSDYVLAALKSWESAGRCTAIGHSRALDSAGAAFVNSMAAQRTRDELLESLRATLVEALEMNRADAKQAAGKGYEELTIAV
jgi:hypothetical protein